MRSPVQRKRTVVSGCFKRGWWWVRVGNVIYLRKSEKPYASGGAA